MFAIRDRIIQSVAKFKILVTPSVLILVAICLFFIGLYLGSTFAIQETKYIYTQLQAFSALPSPNVTIIPYVNYTDTEALWILIQRYREDHNLKKFTISQKLCDLADQRVKEIQTNFSHDGFAEKARTMPYLTVGENLSEHFTAEDTMRAWVKSASHEANLKYPYRYSCLKCENGFCANEFGK